MADMNKSERELTPKFPTFFLFLLYKKKDRINKLSYKAKKNICQNIEKFFLRKLNLELSPLFLYIFSRFVLPV